MGEYDRRPPDVGQCDIITPDSRQLMTDHREEIGMNVWLAAKWLLDVTADEGEADDERV